MVFDPMEARSVLARTPRVLDAWLRGLEAAWLDCDDGPSTWSPRQVVAHLIHGERTDWIPRVKHLLEHGEAVPFRPFDREAHLREPRRPIGELLDEFARLRAESLATFDALAAAGLELDRRGTHPAFGPVTLRQLLATWTAHDLGHLTQIARTMARRYGEEVGPWARYLSVMAGRGGAGGAGGAGGLEAGAAASALSPQAFAALVPGIRYVAIYRDGQLASWQREGLADASAGESDRYEELIVNPTLLTLVKQRGDIDCGGARFVLIRYGNFWELVAPVPGGHISIGLEPAADPVAAAAALEGWLERERVAGPRVAASP